MTALKKNTSNVDIYWKWLLGLFIFVTVINIIFHRYLSVVSFTNLFSIIIPSWIFTFFLHRKEVKRVQAEFTNYMQKNYPDKLDSFYKNYNSDTNPGTKPIFVLFMDKELLKDNNIKNYQQDSNRVIMLFVCVSAITIMVFLISTVFIVRRMYFS